MYALYNSTKFAVEGLSEGIHYELAPLGIQVKLIEPGAIRTEFLGRSEDSWDISHLPDYQDFSDHFSAVIKSDKVQKNSGSAQMVAEVIYTAATDGRKQLRYLAGKDAKQFWFIRRWFGAKAQVALLKKFFNLPT